jgi:hypothetical protein
VITGITKHSHYTFAEFLYFHFYILISFQPPFVLHSSPMLLLRLFNHYILSIGQNFSVRLHPLIPWVKRYNCSSFFKWAPRHKGISEKWRYSSTHSLTSALDGGEWLALRPGRFSPRERAPDTHWIGGRVSTRAVLDAVMKRKIPSNRQNRILGPWSSSP